MDAPPTGFMRRPPGGGCVAPYLVRDVLDAVAEQRNADMRAAMSQAAGLHRLTEGPVTESVAAAVHRAVRRDCAADAGEIMWRAGQATADRLMAHQLSQRAQALLTNAAWPIAAWLLGRWARQHAWAFGGDGGFAVLSAMEFEIADNPLIRGETAAAPLCRYHEALFERLFQRLVDPRLICRETDCRAAGGDACRFSFYLSPETA